MSSMSKTIGAIPATRLSRLAPTIHVVHPRLLAPVTTKRLMGFAPALVTSSTASIARTALWVMGNNNGQVASPVSM
jgi:hypothetical protein